MRRFRPDIRIFAENMPEKILDDAWRVLENYGVIVEDQTIREMLCDSGCMPGNDDQRIHMPRSRMEKYLLTVPPSFELYRRDGTNPCHIGGDAVHFDPGSAAVYWLEPAAKIYRRAVSADCAVLAAITEHLDALDLQATGIVPSDVPEPLADCHRLVFSLVYSSKPVVTGTFRRESFPVMKEMLAVAAGGTDALREKPMAVFDCCPSPPLKWSHLTVNALVDCARSGIPAEMVSMPLAGATAPIALRGAVIQHAAECLSGIVIHQMAGPGSPILWGGSPAAFDMRHGTPPMGAMETMMIDLAYSQVGKYLRMPTHSYMACSDSKIPDYQAGMESGMGAVLAALAGISIVSGPGFLNYENTFSLEKLILDHDACSMALRLVQGIDPHPDLDMAEIIGRHAKDGNFLGDPLTRKLHRTELSMPGKTVYRGTMEEWLQSGKPDARMAAASEVKRLAGKEMNRLDAHRTEQICGILLEEARGAGVRSEVEAILNRVMDEPSRWLSIPGD